MRVAAALPAAPTASGDAVWAGPSSGVAHGGNRTELAAVGRRAMRPRCAATRSASAVALIYEPLTHSLVCLQFRFNLL